MNKLFRKDSLFAKLKTEENRESVFAWAAVDCLGPQAIAEKIKEAFGVVTSAPAVHEMVKRCGLSWRIQRAADYAKQQAEAMPKDLDAAVRLRLRQQFNDLAFENLSSSELLAFREFELAEKKFEADVNRTKEELRIKDAGLKQKDTALKQKDTALKQSERRISLLEDAAKDAKEKLQSIIKGKTKAKGLTADTLKRIEEAARLL